MPWWATTNRRGMNRGVTWGENSTPGRRTVPGKSAPTARFRRTSYTRHTGNGDFGTCVAAAHIPRARPRFSGLRERCVAAVLAVAQRIV
jgi:hypothetical protein